MCPIPKTILIQVCNRTEGHTRITQGHTLFYNLNGQYVTINYCINLFQGEWTRYMAHAPCQGCVPDSSGSISRYNLWSQVVYTTDTRPYIHVGVISKCFPTRMNKSYAH